MNKVNTQLANDLKYDSKNKLLKNTTKAEINIGGANISPRLKAENEIKNVSIGNFPVIVNQLTVKPIISSPVALSSSRPLEPRRTEIVFETDDSGMPSSRQSMVAMQKEHDRYVLTNSSIYKNKFINMRKKF